MNITLRYIYSLIGLVVVILALWFFKSIVTYVLIAGVLSFIGNPLVDLLSRFQYKKIKIPRSLSAATTLLLLWAIFLGFFTFFIPLVIKQANELANVDPAQMVESLRDPLNKLEELIASLMINGSGTFSIKNYVTEKLVGIMGTLQISDFFTSVAKLFGDMFVAAFAISFILFFFLKEEKLFHNVLTGAVPSRFETGFNKSLESIYRLLARYFMGLSIEVILIIILLTIGLSILGFPLETTLVMALFAGLMNVVPYIGPIIGATIGLIIAVATHLNVEFTTELLPLLGWMGLVFLVVQIIDNVVFQPFIYSSSVNAHPLEIFLVILMAGGMAGVAGMVLAIPVYTILRVMAKEFLNQFKVVNKLTEHM